MKRPLRIHLLHAMPKGNIGTVAAQRAICSLLTNAGIDLSISVGDKETFERYHPESRVMVSYPSISPSLGKIFSNLQWALFSFLTMPLFTIETLLSSSGIVSLGRRSLVSRLKNCDGFLDLNLELFKGIPICLSPALIKANPAKMVVHKLFWSYRMLSSLWTLFVLKSAYRKKIILGPASFGPFENLPIVTQRIVKFILNRYVDVILVREPYSAEFLKDLGVKNFKLVADAALLMKPSLSPLPLSNKTPKLTIGFAPALLTNTLTETEIICYSIAHARVIDDLIEKYNADIIFLPSSTPDISMCEMIVKKMRSPPDKMNLIVTDDVDEFEFWIKRLDLLITTRMHPSIIAARNFIPFSSIIYDHKQLGVLQQLGLHNCDLPIGKTTYANLKMLVDNAIENMPDVEKKLMVNLPHLQKESTKTIIDSLI